MFIQRDAQGKIQGCFAKLQPGIAEEFLADDAPEILLFFNPPPDPRKVLDAQELTAAKADATLMSLINMTPTDIGAAIDAAFTDPAQRVILKRICRVLVPTARRVFRNGS
jgi:hypothetical protein